MPPTPEKLSDAQFARIRQWIDGSTEFAPPTEADILPVVQMRCVVCHGKRKQEGGLDLRTHASQMKGGKSGPARCAGKSRCQSDPKTNHIGRDAPAQATG